MEIIIEELMPNLLPFLGAQLIGSVMSAVYQSSGLAILGLGNLREPQLGTTSTGCRAREPLSGASGGGLPSRSSSCAGLL